MNQLEWNSASHVPYLDPTNSSAASWFHETTAPSDNLGSIMRNWVLLLPAREATEDDSSERRPGSETND